ncbi:hypothetical protein ACJMK2_015645 [Sinanodonta woodiana]|uniref:mRNA-decapping enzyme C-terminal domain-containing protein n=1 Tax=Sinanodonta woodiana TaxID=1069815 RepID=A0ABD3US96_SINWO
MILNRLGLNNLIEPITKDLEFQLQDPFLLYRNAKSIYGIWFYDKDECAKVGQLMNSLLQLAIEHHHAKSQGSQRQRRASESDSIDRNESMARSPQPSQVDILQMLSKAQHEYDKTKATSSQKKIDPKPIIDNPNAAATKGSNLIRPTPVKVPDTEESPAEIEAGSSQITPTVSSAPLTLETLFRSATLRHQAERATGYSGTESPSSQKSTLLQRSVSMSSASDHIRAMPSLTTLDPVKRAHDSEMPPLLKHIMSASSMVEDIERQQIEGTPRTISQPHDGQGDVALPTVSKGYSDSKDMSADAILISSIKSAQQDPKSKMPKLSTGLFSKAEDSAVISSSSESLSNQALLSAMSKSNAYFDSGILTTQASSANARQKQPSSLVGLTSSGLVVSSSLLTQVEMPQSSSIIMSTPIFSTSLSSPPSSLSSSPLIPPKAFQSSRKTPPVSEVLPCEEKCMDSGNLPIAPLTKEQMQQSLIYLIKNDPNFINQLHEAYLKSLQDMSGSKC